LRAGLSSAEAERRLSEFGPNQIYKPTKVSFVGIAGREVTEPMILLLLFVGVVYSVWGSLEDAVTIFAVIIALVLAEVNNEYRAVKAITSLSRIAAPRTKVVRDGRAMEIDAEEVVPGDVLILTPGTRIAADAKIAESIGLQLDESPLTGEAVPSDKAVGDGAYAGTTVVSGEGSAIVTETGATTRFGKIAGAAKSVRPPRTKLQLEMKSLSGRLVYVAVFFSVLIPLVGYLQGRNLETMVLTGLSLAFATIPEELPIIITMVLGLGAYTLSRKNFLIKSLSSAETLGTTTVIITDKTGTITEGRMKIASVYPKGGAREIVGAALGAVSDYETSYMDQAIREEARQLGVLAPPQSVFRQRGFAEGRKSKTAIRGSGRGYELFMSGAPEEVFARCIGVGQDVRKRLAAETAAGRRVIAVASRRLRPSERGLAMTRLERGLRLAGLVCFEDPVREGVARTIRDISRGGIRTIMITGDHPLTAGFVARKVGIPAGRVMTGEEVDGLDDDALLKAVEKVSVFSRATPMHKYRIMRALQKNGEVVTATGDGINDVLALEGADIGIAMGIKGTDVAKEAAGVVLADDNYVTIAQGIFEGRKFFDNLRKGIEYYLSVKVALVLIFLLPILLILPLPLAPIQIILLELFMDLAASAGFVAEPKEKDLYTRPPRDPKEPIFNSELVNGFLTKGLALFGAVMVAYLYALHAGLGQLQVQTFAFSAWMIGYVALAFVSRSESEPLLSLGPFSNRVIDAWAAVSVCFLLAAVYFAPISGALNLTPIAPTQLAAVAASTLVVVGLLELRKYVK
jgi:P-type Ca2+ transporter type 2C